MRIERIRKMTLIYAVAILGIAAIVIISIISMYVYRNENSVKDVNKKKSTADNILKHDKKEKENKGLKNKDLKNSKKKEAVKEKEVKNEESNRDKAMEQLNQALGNDDLRNELNEMMKDIREEDEMQSKLQDFASNKPDEATNAIKTLISDE